LADHHGDVQSQWAESVARGQAITDVIAEKQFQGSSPGFVNLLRLTLYDHTGLGHGSTGWDKLAVDFYQTDKARVQRTAFLQVAKGGNVDAEGAGGGEHRLPWCNRQGAAIDCDGGIGHRKKSEGRNPKAERRPKSEIRNAAEQGLKLFITSSKLRQRSG
jgi:hypothetical protein